MGEHPNSHASIESRRWSRLEKNRVTLRKNLDQFADMRNELERHLEKYDQKPRWEWVHNNTHYVHTTSTGDNHNAYQ